MIHESSEEEIDRAIKRDREIALKHENYREKWIEGDLYSSRDGKVWTSVPRSVLLTQIRNLKADKNKAAHKLLGPVTDESNDERKKGTDQ